MFETIGNNLEILKLVKISLVYHFLSQLGIQNSASPFSHKTLGSSPAQDVLGIQQEHQLVDVNGEPLLRRGKCLDAWLVSAVKGGLGCENLVESIPQKKTSAESKPIFRRGNLPTL